MFKKFSAILFCCFLLFVIAGNIQAGAKATWIGPNADVEVDASALGQKLCVDADSYPDPNPGLPITAECEVNRPAPQFGGALSFARCNETSPRKQLFAVAKAWGFRTSADKSLTDTTSCSTYVSYEIIGGILNMDVVGYLYSIDPQQTAIIRLTVSSQGNSIFNGLATLRGSTDNLTTNGDFTNAHFILIADSALIGVPFNGIDVSAYNVETIKVELTVNAHSYIKTPSSSYYGKIALILLMALTAVFLVFRKYRIAA
ncbi:MAG: hypothetical protein R3F48_17585 [Candidatus Zixiibacteriota bacterium]